MKKFITILILIFIVLLAILLIVWEIILPKTAQPYKIDKFNLIELKGDDRPFVWEEIQSLKPNFATDDEGIILYGNKYYNPVQIANIGLAYLDSFQKSQNQDYLRQAEKYASKLIEISQEHNQGLYLPYQFNFAIHEKKEEILQQPWYSGMAQGEALSLFTRLYQETGKQDYKQIADKIFLSFVNLREDNKPWTVWVDEEGYYWIEEYPAQEPGYALNGFIFGLYGVYDYYILTKNKSAKNVLDGSLTTLKHYLPEFRSKGEKSFYCLKHKIQSERYHQTHIEQLKMLFKMTGDDFFRQMADDFYQDFH